MSDESTKPPLTQNAKVERAKALLAVRSIATDEEYRRVRDALVDDASATAIDDAMNGLSKEDDFALMCRLMETATHLTRLEQRPILKGDYLIPDFLARFQPGCKPRRMRSDQSEGFKCSVEVKSTHRDEFKIGGSKLRRLRAFADQFGLPLLIAVRFLSFEHAALWVIVEDAARENSSLTVTYKQLAEGGVRNVVWDDYALIMIADIRLREIYDSSASTANQPCHQEHGALVGFEIVLPDDMPISGDHVANNTATYRDANACILSMFFDSFDPVETRLDRRGDRTTREMRPTTLIYSLADMIYKMNRLPTDSQGRTSLDPSRILAGGAGDSWLITRTFVERVLSDFWNSVFGFLTLGSDEVQYRKWIEFGRTVELDEPAADAKRV